MSNSRRAARLRADAACAVDAVVGKGRTLDAALASYSQRYEGQDRALLAELVNGSVRWYHRLSGIVAAMTDKPPSKLDARILALITVGLYQLWQTRIPDHAAVSETVAAATLLKRQRLSGLVNALLRRFLRERDELLEAARDDPALFFSHPRWLVAQLREDWPESWRQILEANNTRAPMWLRVNSAKTDLAAYKLRAESGESPVELATEAGLSEALKLSAPCDVRALPGFESGEVSVQDGAAQLAADFLEALPGHRVLDACAAPGGKTAHLLERHRGELDLTALDIDAARLERVAETLQRLDLDAKILCGDAATPATWWDEQPYDRILIDAPCSATGVIRRHPDIKLLRRETDIAALADRQLAILTALWPLLAPGGKLVYATCSILKKENQTVVNEFLAAHSNARVNTKLPNDNIRALMAPGRPGFQILPGMADLDGFYYACIAKQP